MCSCLVIYDVISLLDSDRETHETFGGPPIYKYRLLIEALAILTLNADDL